MIGLFAVAGLSGLLGWLAHARWLKTIQDREFERLTSEPYERPLSSYQLAIAEFDRRIQFARDHHLSVKHILAEKETFVRGELKATMGMQNAYDHCGVWRPEASKTYIIGSFVND